MISSPWNGSKVPTELRGTACLKDLEGLKDLINFEVVGDQ